MSSSNRVSLSFIEETTYGETPVGDFDKLAFKSEGLSGTPETTESELIRDDRMGSGQVQVGLSSGGDIAGELRKDPLFDKIIKSAMLSDWSVANTISATLTVDETAKTITRSTGSFIDDGAVKGDLFKFGDDFTENSGFFKVTNVTALTLTVVGKNLADEADVVGDIIRPQYIEIGTTQNSFSVVKEFNDLSDKAMNFTGVLVNTLSVDCTYKQIAQWTAGLVANGYDPVKEEADLLTYGRTVNEPTNNPSMNSSVDLSLLMIDDVVAPYILQKVIININNNYNPNEGIGKIVPYKYTEGEAAITIETDSYLADENWDLIGKKINQSELSIDHVVSNDDGGYAFSVPAFQMSFEDPQASGKNQDLMMNMSGTAKVGPNGEKSLRIYTW